ncbi:hypothetical protein ACLOJK_015387 [Asimina triloba]
MLMELIDRSLVQISGTTSSAGIKTCTVHKLVHQLAVSKANEYSFFSIDDGTDENLYASLEPYIDRCTCYCKNADWVPALKTYFSRLRSLLYINNKSLTQQQLLLEMRKLLRVLDA